MAVNTKCTTIFRLFGLAPYDFSLTVHKPAGWSLLTPFEVYDGETIWTAMRTASGEMLGLKLRSIGVTRKPRVFCEVHSHKKLSSETRKDLSGTIAWMLRLNEDIRPFYALAGSDPLVRMLVKDLYGMRMTGRPDIFPTLTLAVTLQMAPWKRSEQMMNLLIENYGEAVRFDGKEIKYWPSPERIAETPVTELRRRCKLGYRARVLKGIAKVLCEGFPTPQEMEGMSADEAKARLMELRGIGEYSAEIAMPHPGFPLDVWSSRIFGVLLQGKNRGLHVQ